MPVESNPADQERSHTICKIIRTIKIYNTIIWERKIIYHLRLLPDTGITVTGEYPVQEIMHNIISLHNNAGE